MSGGSGLTCIGDESTFSLSYMTFDEAEHEQQLATKIEHLRTLLHDHLKGVRDFRVFPSSPRHFRHRCKFSIVHGREADAESAAALENLDSSTYSNSTPPALAVDEPTSSALDDYPMHYAMWEGGSPSVEVASFPIASLPIYEIMQPLLQYVRRHEILRSGLRAIHFLSTLTGEVVASLVYDIPLSVETWQPAGTALRDDLASISLPSVSKVNVIGRSKKVKLVCGTNTVQEVLPLADGRRLRYLQVEDGFSNPNAAVNTQALGWICESVQEGLSVVSGEDCREVSRNPLRHGEKISEGGLLELYCGNGNHTVAVAG